jgi:hypothetical protein
MKIDFDFSKYWKIEYLYFPDRGSAHPNFRNIKVQHYRQRNRWTREGSSLPWIRNLEAWAGKTESIFSKGRLQQSNKKPNKQFFVKKRLEI